MGQTTTPPPTNADVPLAAQRVDEFLAALAAKQPTPGGGAVASLTGALAAALGSMVLAYTVGKKAFVAHAADHDRAVAALARSRSLFIEYADEDARAYAALNALQRLPEGDASRQEQWPRAVEEAINAPTACLALAAETARVLVGLCGTTNRHLASDLAIAGILTEACAAAARWNILVNLTLLDGTRRDEARARADRLLAACAQARASIEAACVATLASAP